MKKRSMTLVLAAGVLVLVMALGVTAVFAQTDQDPDTLPEINKEIPFHQLGKHGFGEQIERVRDHNELIAAELGVDAEDLQNAFRAALEAAREDGVLGFHGHRGVNKDGEFESYLADALAEIGVSIDDLKAAQEAVKDAMIADLVEQGVITKEQYDMMEARQALKGYIDHAALMTQAADSLGIELPDADEALRNRIAPRALMEQLEEKGIAIQDVMEAMQQAYENAVNAAVDAGAINRDQAELILENTSGAIQGFGGMRGFGGTRGFDGSHGCHRSGGIRGFNPHNSNPAPTGVNL